MNRTIVFLFVAMAGLGLAEAQTQAPMVVVQAAGPKSATAPTVAAAVPVATTESMQVALKALQELKAANDELLKKQAATLQQLEDTEKAAEQMKIYSKRG